MSKITKDRLGKLERTSLDSRFADQDWLRESLLLFVPLAHDGAKSAEGVLKVYHEIEKGAFTDDVGISRRPFCDFLVCSKDPSVLASAREQIERILRDDEVGSAPRIRDLNETNQVQAGFFCGRTLYVPFEYETPRGDVALVVTLDGREARYLLYLGSPGDVLAPAGWYLWQDRMVFGNPKVIPSRFLPDPPVSNARKDGAEILKLDRVFAVRPNASENELCLRVFGADTDDVGSALAKSICKDDGKLVALDHDSQTGVYTADVSAFCHSTEALDEARIEIRPNVAVSHLTTSKRNNSNVSLAVLGLLVPSPAGIRDILEVIVNLKHDNTLVCDSVAGPSSALFLKAGNPVFSRVDHAYFGGSTGLSKISNPRSTSGFTMATPYEVHSNLRATLISRSSDSNINLNNPRLGKDGSRLDAALETKDEYYLLQPTQNEAVLGFFEVPLPVTLNDAALLPDNVRSGVPIQFVRNRTTRLDATVCLDWLDETVQLIQNVNGSQRQVLGLGSYWAQESSRKSKLWTQSFEMREPETHAAFDEDYAGPAVPTIVERGTRTWVRPLRSEYVFQVGPLIVRPVLRDTTG